MRMTRWQNTHHSKCLRIGERNALSGEGLKMKRLVTWPCRFHWTSEVRSFAQLLLASSAAALCLLACSSLNPKGTSDDSADTCSVDTEFACGAGQIGYDCSGSAVPPGNCVAPRSGAGFSAMSPDWHCCSSRDPSNVLVHCSDAAINQCF